MRRRGLLLTSGLIGVGVLAVAVAVVAMPERWTLSYTFRGESLRYVVTAERIGATPAWDASDFGTLPLPLADAVAEARKGLSELTREHETAPVAEIQLSRFGATDHWLYVISFDSHGRARIPVFLNGVHVRPIREN